VTFRDKRMLATSNVEALSVALILFAPLLLLLFGLIIVFKLTDQTAWLWPQTAAPGVYPFVFTINLVLGLGLAGEVLGDQDPVRVLVVAYVLPVVGSLAAWFALRKPDNPSPWRALLRGPVGGLWADHRQGHVLVFASLLLITVVLPCAAFFKVAMGSELELLVKQAQHQLASDLARRANRLRTDAVARETPAPFLEARLNSLLDRYETSFFGTTVAQAEPRPPAADRRGFAEFFAHVRPRFGGLAMRTRPFIYDAAEDGSWTWRRESGRTLAFYNAHPGPDSLGALGITRIATPLPRWELGARGGPVLLFLAAMALLTAFFVWFIADKVFLLRVTPRAPPPLADVPWKKPGGRFLVLGEPSDAEFASWRTMGATICDLAKEDDRKKLASPANASAGRSTEMVVLCRFEAEGSHPSPAPEKFSLLETLLCAGGA
jgi:hypothetical protein